MKQHLPKVIVALVVLAAVIVTWRLYSGEDETVWYGYAEGEYILMGLPGSGNLEALYVRRGDSVTAGQPLFELEKTGEEADLQAAEGRLEEALAFRDNLLKGLRDSEIDEILGQKEQAEADLVLARQTLERQKALFAEGHVSEQRVDDARAVYDKAKGRVDELEARLVTARLPAREDEIRRANAAIGAARAGADAARYRLSKRQAAAPEDAFVFDTFYRVGEFVQANKAVVSLLPEKNVKIRFFVAEADLAGMKLGQKITVHCDGCGEGVAARVTYISPDAEFTPPVIYSEDARQKLVYLIEAYPDDPAGFPLKPGQPLEIPKPQ